MLPVFYCISLYICIQQGVLVQRHKNLLHTKLLIVCKCHIASRRVYSSRGGRGPALEMKPSPRCILTREEREGCQSKALSRGDLPLRCITMKCHSTPALIQGQEEEKNAISSPVIFLKCNALTTRRRTFHTTPSKEKTRREERGGGGRVALLFASAASRCMKPPVSMSADTLIGTSVMGLQSIR